MTYDAATDYVAHPPAAPAPGSAEECRRFAELQRRLAPLCERVFTERLAAQTVVVVPSLTLDPAELAKLVGAHHYEERLLCMLMLLRLPHTNLVYVTSQPVAPTIVDYYLHLLPGVPLSHARRRLTLLSCHDGSDVSLTEKLLARPRLLERIRAAVPDARAAHVTCFNATPLERTLAVALGLPLYACDPALAHLGSKSGSREVFREAGVALPAGFEHLRDAGDVADALAALKREQPSLRRAVVKLDEGFSGEGNAVFSYDGAPPQTSPGALEAWVRRELPARLRFEAAGETWEQYAEKFARMRGVVESFLEGDVVRSPSAQCRIDPAGGITVISAHDQVLGGPSGQVYQGCRFPADPAYGRGLPDAARRVADVLRRRGVIGRFGVDFVTVARGNRWEHAAIEINLRKGGTTHPYLMLQFLTDGAYDAEAAVYRTSAGQPRYYVASDNLCAPAYRALTPEDLVDVAVDNELHFDAATQQGVVFHLIGAVAQFGKLGALCVGDSPASAERYYRETVTVLDREARGSGATGIGRGLAPGRSEPRAAA